MFVVSTLMYLFGCRSEASLAVSTSQSQLISLIILLQNVLRRE